MKFKKFFFVTCLIICLFTIASVCAGEMDDEAMTAIDSQDDLDINVCKEKQLTNMRTHASDGAIQLTPYTQLSLEQCLDFLLDDELLEVTPKSLRLRKRQLDPVKRKRESRN
ncbi:MAG: hypothetical protein Q4Q37_05215 [Methanobrevibacter sp.]|nr:hypothetical protein [Methanobrevibacter sp.]